ncbi:MAG: hypothetical protein ACI9IL_000139 [Rickettsiales bacterium]|jgi:hypothetical protein
MKIITLFTILSSLVFINFSNANEIDIDATDNLITKEVKLEIDNAINANDISENQKTTADKNTNLNQDIKTPTIPVINTNNEVRNQIKPKAEKTQIKILETVIHSKFDPEVTRKLDNIIKKIDNISNQTASNQAIDDDKTDQNLKMFILLILIISLTLLIVTIVTLLKLSKLNKLLLMASN